MKTIAIGTTMLLIFFALMVPVSQAKVYHAEDYVEAKVELLNVSYLPRPKMYPGGGFTLDIYLHNKLLPRYGDPFYKPKGLALYKMFWKIDWEDDEHTKEWGGDNVIILWENDTKFIWGIDVKIPKNVRLGAHNISFEFWIYLYGSGWDGDQGSDLTPLKVNYSFYVKQNPQSVTGNAGVKESTVFPWVVVTGAVLIFVVAVIVVIAKTKRKSG